MNYGMAYSLFTSIVAGLILGVLNLPQNPSARITVEFLMLGGALGALLWTSLAILMRELLSAIWDRTRD